MQSNNIISSNPPKASNSVKDSVINSKLDLQRNNENVSIQINTEKSYSESQINVNENCENSPCSRVLNAVVSQNTSNSQILSLDIEDSHTANENSSSPNNNNDNQRMNSNVVRQVGILESARYIRSNFHTRANNLNRL
ncbi:hypothetical protein AYI68_g126 [Smittium mucronatum]|uniref:Uncharacterized protein n=1 Tax=Smittium mucronatum TaxID=133383 RepID=A0A1R0H945_9FUNG|nr:hypothetical protein AYI68_g126 [Smittium mucronatum]